MARPTVADNVHSVPDPTPHFGYCGGAPVYLWFSPVHLVMLLLQFQLFCLRLWNPDLFTSPAVFDSLSLPHLLALTLNDRLWKVNWYLLLRCWPVAPSTTTVIIIIWFCSSSMIVWTSWPCSVIISTRHSQKRTCHPSEPGSSLGFFLGSCLSREFFLATVLQHLHCLLFGVLGWVSVQLFVTSADVKSAW